MVVWCFDDVDSSFKRCLRAVLMLAKRTFHTSEGTICRVKIGNIAFVEVGII